MLVWTSSHRKSNSLPLRPLLPGRLPEASLDVPDRIDHRPGAHADSGAFTHSNDFAFYDHVLDMSFVLGNVPSKYAKAAKENNVSALDTMFAMGRGRQRDGVDVEACESAYSMQYLSTMS